MIAGITLNLGDVPHVVPPLTLGTLEALQPRLAEFLQGKNGLAGAPVVIDAVFAALKRNYPDIERQTVADGIDVATMGDFTAAILDISGAKRKDIEAGRSANTHG
jgi:hypothetical protein